MAADELHLVNSPLSFCKIDNTRGETELRTDETGFESLRDEIFRDQIFSLEVPIRDEKTIWLVS